MSDIRQGTVLPARREPVTLHTTDGLRLVGELALPERGDPKGTLVCVHPLPTHGGSMESHLIRKASYRLPALAGIAVLRFNTRGTGGSEGTFDGGNAERYDLAAALDLVESRDLPAPWALGWSFGSEVVLRYAADDPSVVGGIAISPPLRTVVDADLDRWAATGKPLVAVVPELDDYVQPPEARQRLARVPQAEVVVVERAKHLLVGFTELVMDVVAGHVVPGSAPLPTTYAEGDPG